jgi:3-methyladenine DNA glycosylase AlkD
MNLFDKTRLAWKKILEWSGRDEEFVKRAAFALIACLAWHNKAASDEDFIRLMPVIQEGATDERNFVKKAVSWALRNIGKRNPKLDLDHHFEAGLERRGDLMYTGDDTSLLLR